MSLQSERQKAGYSQRTLAEASGVSKRVIEKYEQGERDINGAGLEILCKLATALGCTIFDILTNDDLKEQLRQSI